MSFKDDLGEALQKAVAYYNGGDSADDAIAKTAQDMGFNFDQADRLVEKFNTAKTIHHFETHPDDRTQNFEIASKEKVAAALRGDESSEKKASAGGYADEWHDYTSYDVPEESMFKLHSDSEISKQASAVDKSDRGGYSVNGLERMITSRIGMHDDIAKRAEDAAGMISARVTTELSKIARAVMSGYDPEDRYAMFKLACGGNRLFKDLDGLFPEWVKKPSESGERRIKTAGVLNLGDLQQPAIELEALSKLVGFAERFEKVAERQNGQRRKMMSSVLKTAAIVPPTDSRSGRGRNGRPGPTPPLPSGGGSGGGSGGSDGGRGGDRRQPNPKDDEKEKRRQVTYQFLGIGSETLPAARKAVTMGVDGDDIAAALKPREKGPSLKEHINNLRRSSILNDLYANDPILSEADPHDVMSAYKTIVESSPEVSMNKEVVRAILRQSVNSVAVSPFDVKQWADLENVLLKNKGYSSGKVPIKA